MSKEALLAFVEGKINGYADQIKTKSDRKDRSALGELTFYVQLRTVLTTSASELDLEALGLIDAINDLLQYLNIIPKGNTFYKV